MMNIWMVMAVLGTQVATGTEERGAAPRVRMIDVDGDGRLDRVAQPAPGLLSLSLNRGGRQFEESLQALPGFRFVDVLVTDLDGDGHSDLYLVGQGANAALLGDGTGGFTELTESLGLEDHEAGRSAQRLDVDGDGLEDVLLHNAEGDVLFWRSAGGGYERDAATPARLVTLPQPVTPLPREAARVEPAATDEGESIAKGGESSRARSTATRSRLSVQAPMAEEEPFAPVVKEVAPLACARTIEDASSGACLSADSTPTLGRLFPISQELFVDAGTGRVGIGTTAPGEELSVAGDVSLTGGMKFEQTGGIEFERSGAAAEPMITLYSDNNFGAEERMILGYSPQAPTYGLAYRDSEFDFRFQEFTDDPTFDIDMGVKLNSFVDLFLSGSNVGIEFVGDNPGAAPMITMPFGTSGTDARMVLSHSATDPQRGLNYQEGSQSFQFQRSDTAPVMTVGTQNRTVEIHDRLEVESQDGPPASFSITNTLNPSTVFRGVTSGTGRVMMLSGLNASSTVPTLEAGAIGSGDAIAGFSYGAGAGVAGEAWGATGSAGRFDMQSFTNTGPAVIVTSNGPGNGLEVHTSAEEIYGIHSVATGLTTYGVYGESPNIGVVGTHTDPSGLGIASLGDFVAAGSKSFSMPHPKDASKEIRFACLEGNESGTYFRGTTDLVGGRLAIPVPEEFRLVSEEDGLSVQLTAIGAPARLWVERQDLESVVVRGDADVRFHYLVQGIRRGYSEWEPIHENTLWVPRYGNEEFGTQYPEPVRRLLVENGTLNADFTPNRATADRLGWNLRDRERPTATTVASPAGPPASPRFPAPATGSATPDAAAAGSPSRSLPSTR